MKKNFVTVTPDTGSNNGSLSVTVDENTSDARSEIITVAGGGVSKTLMVNQDAGNLWEVGAKVEFYFGSTVYLGEVTKADDINGIKNIIIHASGCRGYIPDDKMSGDIKAYIGIRSINTKVVSENLFTQEPYVANYNFTKVKATDIEGWAWKAVGNDRKALQTLGLTNCFTNAPLIFNGNGQEYSIMFDFAWCEYLAVNIGGYIFITNDTYTQAASAMFAGKTTEDSMLKTYDSANDSVTILTSITVGGAGGSTNVKGTNIGQNYKSFVIDSSMILGLKNNCAKVMNNGTTQKIRIRTNAFERIVNGVLREFGVSM